MELNSALLVLSKIQNAMCRRAAWGESAKHVYLRSCARRGDSLILVNEAGGEAAFLPSLEDQLASDWLTD